MAKLYFRYGAMGSSKSANILMVRYNYEERGQYAVLLKPRTDNRDGEHEIQSRIGLAAPAEYVDDFLKEISKLWNGKETEYLYHGKKVNAILKDIQFHPVKDTILHVDFYQIDEAKPIVMEVPVQLEGLAEGVKAGGKLALQMRKIKVKALYNVIPEKLIVNVSHLGLGKTVKVGELSFEGLELISAKEAVVCAVKLTRAARGAAAAAGK